MKVLFINNDGGGFAGYKTIDDGMTVSEFISEEMKGDPESYLIRVNRQPVAADYVLQYDDRLTVTPTKIQGAYLRGSSASLVDHRLDYLDDDDATDWETDGWVLADPELEESEIDFDELIFLD